MVYLYSMSTYRVNVYRVATLVAVLMVRAPNASDATARVATNNPGCEAIGEGS
jgi:hypothetical protein